MVVDISKITLKNIKEHGIRSKERECPICHKIFIANRMDKKCCSQKCSSKLYYKIHRAKIS